MVADTKPALFPLRPEDHRDIEKYFNTDSDLWNDAQANAAESILVAGKSLALTILRNVPSCADRSAAIRKVRETVSTALDAVSCEAGAYASKGKS